ncbi:MAG: uroporphyrinogen decarboxylase [Actinobacteria bacterium]|uniref:uroporphyrinogen decarboxylase n=1 Tax=freshwater metagenome TaxID=449393 RepID=A0A6J7NM52_9ZZZZ|nr:uroporphyrinogen decarboxylase [Actinomycetota bacterium]MSW40787.1 uroporphyrinogen decarboxylase [Actinomycetota bacterium]
MLGTPHPRYVGGMSEVALPSEHPLTSGVTAASPAMVAYRGGQPDTRPIWMMRQAGRSLPEYRRVREGIPMLESCLRPDLVTEITLQPVRRHRVDAAILFSDIVIPLKLAGVEVDIVAGVGPVMAAPVRTVADVRALRPLSPDALTPITDAVGMIVEQLGSTPLIGFAGAPFTLASYLVEGRPSRDYQHTLAMMRDEPALWHELLGHVALVTGAFLRAQAMAGASAVQLFDSWVGALTPAEYVEYAQPHSATVLAAVSDLPVPRIHFGTRSRPLLALMRDAGATVMGVDFDTPLDEANEILGGTIPLQGNINPGLLAGEWAALEANVRDVVRRGESAPGHVVNLGHGVPPETDPDVLTRMVELVHSIP